MKIKIYYCCEGMKNFAQVGVVFDTKDLFHNGLHKFEYCPFCSTKVEILEKDNESCSNQEVIRTYGGRRIE